MNLLYMKKILLAFTMFSLFIFGVSAQTPEKDERMKWWREARLGMFIHWGVYAVPAGTYKGPPHHHNLIKVPLPGALPLHQCTATWF